MRNISAASLGGIALLALVLHTQLPSSRDEAAPGRGSSGAGKAEMNKSKASEATKQDNFLLEGPWMATRAYFNAPVMVPDQPVLPDDTMNALLTDLVAADGTPKSDALRSLLGATESKDTASEVRSIIVTLPDPLHTRLSLLLDQQLEALLRSLATVGWSFAGQWLPWTDRAEAGESDLTKIHKQNALKRWQEEMPGVLIFRSGPPFPPERTLLVFVVGETPTSGIGAAQFFAAAHMAETLSANREIGLLAPTFSGSFPSLTKVVKAWRDSRGAGWRVHNKVFSGNVSNQTYAKAFSTATGLELHGGTFDAEASREAVCITLARLGVPFGEAALLKEDNSGYSEAVSNKDRPAQGSNCTSQIPTYVFPRDISHLRNAYQEAIRTAGQDPYMDQSPRVGLTLKDPNIGEDSVPTFSDMQTPLAQQTMLDSITRDFRRQRTRIVFVAATNSLDTLFLARVLHRDCPDTRILIDYPHVVFEAAADAGLAGTLFLSTYPMFPDGERVLKHRDTNTGENLQFPDTNSQGLFNVTQLLIANLKAWPDGKEVGSLNLQGYQAPISADQRPVMWLLALSRAGFRPLDWIQTKATWFEPAGSPMMPQAPREFLPRKSWSIVVLVLSGAVLLLCWKFQQVNSGEHAQALAWLSMHGASEVGWQALVGVALSLSSLVWLLTLPALQSALWPSPLVLLNILRGPVVLVVALAACTAPPLVVARTFLTEGRKQGASLVRRRGEERTASPYLLMALAVPLLLYAIVVLSWAEVCFGYDIRSFWFRYRALELFWGHSPLWPPALLCVLLLYFSYSQFRRHARAGVERPLVSFVDPAGDGNQSAAKYWRDFQASYENLNANIEVPGAKLLSWRTGASALFAGLILALLWRPVTSFEPWLFDLALRSTLFVVLFWLGVAVHDIVSIGSYLREFLTQMDLLPLHSIVRRIARDWPRRPIRSFGRSVSRLRIRKQMLTALLQRTLLLEADPTQAPAAAVARAQFEDLRKLAFGEEPGHTQDEMHRKYEERVSEVTTELLWHEVMPFWRTSPSGEDERDEPLATVDDATQRARRSSEFVALQLCRFIVYAVAQLGRLATCVSVSFLILMVFFTSYSPQGPRFIARALAGIFVIFGAGIAPIFVYMERNSILSWISRTTPGKLNAELWMQLAALGGLPLLGVLGHLFPEISGFMSQWVMPTFQSLR